MTAEGPVRAVINADQQALSVDAECVVDAIRQAHGEPVRALIFYGSALRPDRDPDAMFDFYVLVDRYRDIYPNILTRVLTWLAPPGVHYLETDAGEGRMLRSKYSIVSLPAFHRRARGGALESMLWARFAQSATVVTADRSEHERLLETLALAARHFAHETAPLLSGPVEPGALWERGLYESYRTELRPEDPRGRARSIVMSDKTRYEALARALYDDDGAGRIVLPVPGTWSRAACRLRWFTRRIVGKPMGGLRVIKASLTFGARLDYVLEKIEKHSGVRIEVSEAERRHPVRHAPVLAWRLFRRGAFR